MSRSPTTTDEDHMLRELDCRQTPEGDCVALWWDDETDVVQLVLETTAGPTHTVTVARERATDAFWHPWAYMPLKSAA